MSMMTDEDYDRISAKVKYRNARFRGNLMCLELCSDTLQSLASAFERTGNHTVADELQLVVSDIKGVVHDLQTQDSENNSEDLQEAYNDTGKILSALLRASEKGDVK